jgi:phosphoribosylformylglycinamidine (FGAM) synthase-like amidotransferase family enzyme
MTVHQLCEELPFESINQEEDRAVKGVFCCDLLSVAMAKAPEDSAWVTVIGNANTVAVAALADVACIVLAEGFSYDDAAINAAKGKVALIKSGKPSYETAVSIGALV